MKPFAREGTGALWTLLNDELVGYIGTEGECGIVARNIDEFMNIVSTLKCSFIRLKDEKDFTYRLLHSNFLVLSFYGRMPWLKEDRFLYCA